MSSRPGPEDEADFRAAYAFLAAGQAPAAAVRFTALLARPGCEADACNGLGLCAEALDDPVAAEAHYRRALALRQDPEFYNNLAICLQRQGREADALDCFRQLARLLPEPQVRYNLALALLNAGAGDEAFDVLAALLAGPRVQAQALHLLQVLSRGRASDPAWPDLLLRRPDQAAAQLALADRQELQGQSAQALRHFGLALALNPALALPLRDLVYLLQDQGEDAAALQLARRLYAWRPSRESLRELLFALQPPLCASGSEGAAFEQESLQLLAKAGEYPLVQGPLLPIPNFACYRSGEDLPLQTALASFYAGFAPALPARARSAGKSRPRLGLLSGSFWGHSTLDLLGRACETLLAALDFESLLLLAPLSANSRRDARTQALASRADRVLEWSEDQAAARHWLAGLDLDLLIYPDPVLLTGTYALALQRLARHQLVLPGFPVTTGMATIDYFVSGAELDPPGAEASYRERLVRLPGLPDYERPVVPPDASRAELGLPAGRLYFCPMTLFKFSPAFDDVMAGILSADPEARLLLLEHKHGLHQRLLQRFAGRWPALAGRLQFLPWSNRETFFQRLRAVDVLLDSFPFGGGNTAYQAFGLGCPIICLDQPWNKGRWTQALYRQMGITELIAATPADYIALAVGLARDPERQARLRAELLARNGVLFDNPTWSQALLGFCRGLVAA